MDYTFDEFKQSFYSVSEQGHCEMSFEWGYLYYEGN